MNPNEKLPCGHGGADVIDFKNAAFCKVDGKKYRRVPAQWIEVKPKKPKETTSQSATI